MFADEKKKKNGGDIQFDNLEDKLDGKMANVSISDKSQAKYADGGAGPRPPTTVDKTLQKLRNSFKKGEKKSTQSLNIGEKDKAAAPSKRSNSIEKSNDLTMGLFGAASVVCNIVEISKDSTMKGKKAKAIGASGKKDSISSDGGKPSGPFSSMKEAASKKKASMDDSDDD